MAAEEKPDCEEENGSRVRPSLDPALATQITKSVYPHNYVVNALDVSSGADGVRSFAGRRLWVPRDSRYHLVIGQLVSQKAA
jgi:hypothetical protein